MIRFNQRQKASSANSGTIFALNSNNAGGTELKDSISLVSAKISISGTRYGIVNGAVTQFAANQPPIEDTGLRGCPAFTQYFLNNETPATQSITLAAGSYCLWIEGSGSATFNGLTATAGVPKVFTLASGFTGNCVITGTVTKTMLNSGLFPAPFSPTQGVTKSFVSEAATATTGMSFDLDDAKLSRLKTALRGPNGQGHLELEFVSNFDSSWLSASPISNEPIFSTSDTTYLGSLRFRKDTSSTSIRFDDSANTGVFVNNSVVVGQLFKIALDWGYLNGVLKMRLTVNGVKSSIVNFSGSFGGQDLKFFFGNIICVGWIKKNSLKIYNKPRWR